MYHLIVVALTQPVYGFQGTIAPQNEAARYMDSEDLAAYKKKFTKSVFFRGGGGQVYIPNLTQAYVHYIVPAGVVNIYDDIDDITDFLAHYKVI
jgi:hypothetical protein